MNYILDQIDAAVAASILYPAITTALIVPDVGGAVDWPSEKNSGKRYAQWFNNEMSSYSQSLDGYACYALRCKWLHEGLANPARAHASKKSNHPEIEQIAFMLPNSPGYIHNVRGRVGGVQGEALALDAVTFCNDMTNAARAWLAAKQWDEDATNRLESLVAGRLDLGRWFRGPPMICAKI